jgi:hypothetical protein
MQTGSKPTRNEAVHSLFADSERKSRLKERIAFLLETAMSIATYRGVSYNTEEHQANFKTWWNRIHCDATRWFTYRGKQYRAAKECQL